MRPHGELRNGRGEYCINTLRQTFVLTRQKRLSHVRLLRMTSLCLWVRRSVAILSLAGSVLVSAFAVLHAQSAQKPWMNDKLSPAERARLVLHEMTLDEKISLLHGVGMPGWAGSPKDLATYSIGGAGYVAGVERLGIPPLQISDAAYGIRASGSNGRYSTALPSNIAAAASWDVESSCSYGRLIGRELRAQGFNMTLGGGVNLTREPRNGRTFEYMGEDPVLAGTMVGNRIRCEQAEHVIGHIKHYAMNDQESGRMQVDVHIGERAMRESDLLAFEIGIEIGKPSAVMCSYNGINGEYACENKHLLAEVLKHDWKFPGFVISDWGATHSAEKASGAGLDQEQPLGQFFGEPLKQAVQAGRVSVAEIDDHAGRVLWAEFASGLFDHPTQKSVVDAARGLAVARHVEEGSAVLLKNQNAILPLDRSRLRSIAVIGPHADQGMISGGGSAQVDAPGSPNQPWRSQVWFPPSPVETVQAKASGAKVSFASGQDIAQAVALAKASDVAIVFVYQWEAEEKDLADLSLPDNQDALVAAVTSANPRTVVVVESGTAVLMPWLQSAAAVLEAWYAGSDGANAVANLLFGEVNPSGKLPMTFPANIADLPHPRIDAPPPNEGPRHGGTLTFQHTYDEGLKVGYKWYDAEHKPVLFPFGYGLSYTTFAYGELTVASDGASAKVTVTNTGKRAGAEVVQVYVALPRSTGEPPKRLVGFAKVQLDPGEHRAVEVTFAKHALEVWDEGRNGWTRPAGEFSFMAGGSSATLPLHQSLQLR